MRRSGRETYNPLSMITKRLLAALPVAAVAALILFTPSDAQAWGPLAHLNFSAQALANLGAVQPSMRGLLQEFGHDFLYGSLAADIVVGKNMARYLYHCHNWRVGFNVFKQAKPGAEQAFSLGFLAHLAADTVAHNYFVPYKTVASFHKTNTRHAYWELRYDQRMDRALSRLARQVSTRALREHDAFLDRTLAGASVIPFGVSKQLFRSLLVSARMSRFPPRLALGAGPRAEPRARAGSRHRDERPRARGDRRAARRGGAKRGRPRRRDRGAEHPARERPRKQLKDRTARRYILPRDAHEIAAETRESFRGAIRGKLVLPRSSRSSPRSAASRRHPRTAGVRGSSTVNVVPRPRALSSVTRPPCASTIWRTMNRPSPNPLTSR